MKNNLREWYEWKRSLHFFGGRNRLFKDPRQQKALGRAVKNFDRVVWESKCREYVYLANKAKFLQNDDILRELLKTVGTTIVEASPDDNIWGIGLSAEDPMAQNRSIWKGTNWLGEVLTSLRDEIAVGQNNNLG
ncbi:MULTISPECIES: NADAR family protein [unclassified Paenibacillus]|uniref:NADAR family protein n=1 Tax=unclassified Paenibacillus TaxID=185978 RepID=UPI00363049F8